MSHRTRWILLCSLALYAFASWGIVRHAEDERSWGLRFSERVTRTVEGWATFTLENPRGQEISNETYFVEFLRDGKWRIELCCPVEVSGSISRAKALLITVPMPPPAKLAEQWRVRADIKPAFFKHGQRHKEVVRSVAQPARTD